METKMFFESIFMILLSK